MTSGNTGKGGVSAADQAAVSAQLGRTARGIRSIAHRCSCGLPDVVETEPRLPDGTPFPTTFYITCPRLASAIGTLEAGGMMKEMTERLGTDEELAKSYQAAHESYLAHRESIEHVAEIDGITAGGMPTRVKCVHVLVGHSLAEGPGVNPLGDEALAALSDWGRRGPCVDATPDAPGASDARGGRVPGASDARGGQVPGASDARSGQVPGASEARSGRVRGAGGAERLDD